MSSVDSHRNRTYFADGALQRHFAESLNVDAARQGCSFVLRGVAAGGFVLREQLKPFLVTVVTYNAVVLNWEGVNKFTGEREPSHGKFGQLICQ